MSRVRIKQAAPKVKVAAKAAPKVRGRAALRQSAPTPSAAALASAAAQPTRALPQRRLMEHRFGRDLSHIGVVQSPEAEHALDTAGAEAATVDGHLLLRPEADQATIAHELAHALQHHNGQSDDLAAAETEAQRAEAQIVAGQPVEPIRAGLAPGAIAYKMPESLAGVRIIPRPDPEAERAFGDAADTPDVDKEDTGPQDQAQTTDQDQSGAPQVAPDQTTSLGDQASGLATGQAPEEKLTPTFAAPPIPELEVDTDAAQAKAEAVEAKLSAATDATAMMAAFRAAPPSVKAKHHDQLARQSKALNQKNQTQFEANLPAFDAKLSGKDDLEKLPPVAAPGQEALALEARAPVAAPTPEVSPTQAVSPAKLNRDGGFFAGFFTAGDAGSMGTAFAKVSTSDKDVDTSAGKRPNVPTRGATDPARIAEQHKAAGDQAEAKREAATQKVIDGRGPTEVGLRNLKESFPLPERALPDDETAETTAPGAVAFREGGHDAEVTALFDAHHAEQMSGSLAQAEADTSAAVTKRDADREQKVKDAEAETAKLNREADGTQRSEALARRKDIQTARTQAVSDQQTQVTALKTQAETDRKAAKAKVDTQITTTDNQVSKDFAKAETDAKAEVTKGETKAEAERNRQKDAASKQSWWDRAKNWVKAQFDKLTKFINDVFDAVRKAVKKLIDTVKAAALKLIDLAAKAIKSVIETLGKALKAAVTALLSKHFPAIAKKLNDAIDQAVTAAKSAVDKVAEGLKKAVSAVLNLLGKAIDGILALYQKAITAALNLVKIALTADWGALAKMILEPILKAFGINPAEFYALIGKAIDALDRIVKNPGQFISNLIKALVGGLKLFTAKLFEHLQKGIIGWLTGALGSDLKIPKTWSLFGVLDLGRQIMGLTLDFIRRIAVRVVGEKAVTVIEQVMETIGVFMKEGFAGLWNQIKGALGQLQSLVLDQIKTFLMERVLMAAVTWIASLFNPAGAVAKLIMMTWNVLMFIKDQFARMVELVKKVFGTIYEIATGVLEPAQKGVEAVLGRLLPMAIDLFARLLGLGNVAGRVKKIIDGVRQKIEDAIVKLIKRIAGRGKGKGGKKQGKKQDRTDDLMKHKPVKGGGQSHTLFVREKGRKAVPVMRSVETPVGEWLKSLKTLAGVNAANRKIKGDQRREKRDAIAQDVAQALSALAAMQRAADSANTAEDNKNAQALAAAKQRLETEAQTLSGKMATIFTELDIVGDGLAKVYRKDIAALNHHVKTAATNAISKLDPVKYGTKPWAQMTAAAYDDGVLTSQWQNPAVTRGVIQATGVRKDYIEAVAAVADPHCEGKLDGGRDKDAVATFLNQHLTRKRLTTDANRRRLALFMLTPAAKQMVNLTSMINQEIVDAARDYAGGGETGPDVDFSDKVKISTTKGLMKQFATRGVVNETFQVYEGNVITGKKGKTGNLLQFVSERNITERFKKNRTHMASNIRNSKAGHDVDRPHEWIQAAHADHLLTLASKALEGGDVGAIKRASDLIEFQDKVRSTTTKLVFIPETGKPWSDVTVSYKAPQHRASAAHKDTAQADLPDAQKDAWYPSGSPQQGNTVNLLQSHSGGLYAYAQSGAHTAKLVSQSTGSSSWHETVEKEVKRATIRYVSSGSKKGLKDAIIDHYKSTIWYGKAQFADAPSRAFAYYYRGPSDTTSVSYDDLKREFATEAKKEETRLGGEIDTVLNT